MFSLQFRAAGQRPLGIGPAPYFRIEGGRLLQGPDNKEVALHLGGIWKQGDMYFTAAAITSSVRIHFEKDGVACSGSFGPYEEIVIADGSIRHGPNGQHLLARLDDATGLWHVYLTGQNCPAAVILPSLAPAGA